MSAKERNQNQDQEITGSSKAFLLDTQQFFLQQCWMPPFDMAKKLGNVLTPRPLSSLPS